MRLLPAFCKVRKANSLKDYRAFARANPQIDVPHNYLRDNDVYLLLRNEELIGGFVYALGPNFRYVDRMADSELREKYGELFQQHKVAEITIVWIKKDYRKSIYSLIFWAYAALKCFLGPAKFIVFGTSVPILVRAFEYPRNTVNLLTYELKPKYRKKYNLGPLSLFMVERRQTLTAMFQGVFFLIFRPRRNQSRAQNVQGLRVTCHHRPPSLKAWEKL